MTEKYNPTYGGLGYTVGYRFNAGNVKFNTSVTVGIVNITVNSI